MKKITLIAICLAVVCAFAGCTTGNAPDPASEPVSLGESAPAEPVILEDESENVDHEAVISSLGFLLAGTDWAQPGDIAAENMVVWYAYHVRETNLDNAEYMSKYLVEGQDEFFFPAAEFEAAVQETFGIDAEIFRENAEVYNEETRTYKVPTEMPDLAESTTVLTGAEINGDENKITFLLTVAGEEPVVRILTVLNNAGKITLVSYSGAEGFVAQDESEEVTEAESEALLEWEETGAETPEEAPATESEASTETK